MRNSADLIKRYNLLEAELSFQQRKREEEAVKVVESIHRISKEDVDKLSAYLPDLPNLINVTVESLLQNKNHEIERIESMYETLYKLLDNWLTQYEERLGE